MKIFLKNKLSLPFNSNLIFKTTEYLLNKSSLGYILSFHDLSPEVFKSHIQSLKPSTPIHLNELIKRYKLGKSNKNCFAITFDDGVRTTVLRNLEVCEENNWPVTFYLPTNYIDGENLPFQKIQLLDKILENKEFFIPSKFKNNLRKKSFSKLELINFLKKIIYYKEKNYIDDLLSHFLDICKKKINFDLNKKFLPKPVSWSEVRNISKNELVSFQSHSVSHTACVGMTENELKNEMLISKKKIQDNTQKEVTGFCYPYGSAISIGQMSIEVASNYFDHATTLIKGRLNKNSNVYYLPRIDLYEENSCSFVKMKIAIS